MLALIAVSVVACALWWLLCGLVVANLRAARRLEALPLPDAPSGGDDWPSLSVIIPACNEGDTLGPAMGARLAAEYPALEVVIVDDRSTDDTGAVADELAASDERVRVVHNTTLPEGWLGKVHALKLGADAARGDWLLFSDADVVVEPGTLRRAIAHCLAGGWDVLAAMPTVTATGPVESGLHAFLIRGLYAAFRVRAVENPRSSYGIGVGAFTLVRRSALEASAGFEAFRLDVADDLMLGRTLKQSGARCTALNGAGALRVDLYPTLWDFVRGAEKNAWAVSGGFSLVRGLAVALLVPLLELAPFAVAALAGPLWLRALGAATSVVALVTAAHAMAVTGRKPWGGLIAPFGAFVFAFAAVRGTLIGWRRGGLQWRDTFYPTSVFLEARRARSAAEKQQRRRT